MQTSTAATQARGQAITTTPTVWRPSRTKPMLLMALGVTVLSVATLTLFVALPEEHRPAPGPASPPAAPAAGLTIQGPGDITVLNMTYEPGETTGWHAHRGIHAVAILAGELAVYDAGCVRTTYGPDNPYIGGQQLHLIRNETGAPVPMVVTYLNPVTASQPAHVITTPPACAG